MVICCRRRRRGEKGLQTLGKASFLMGEILYFRASLSQLHKYNSQMRVSETEAFRNRTCDLRNKPMTFGPYQ